jgi:hypothetical protein
MLRPKRWDIKCWRNSNFPDRMPQDVISLRMTNAAGLRAPYDLTGQLIEMQVRHFEGESDPALLNLSSAAGSGDRIDVLDSRQGQFRIVISTATLEGLPTPSAQDTRERASVYAYDVRGGGLILFYGDFIVREGVTR